MKMELFNIFLKSSYYKSIDSEWPFYADYFPDDPFIIATIKKGSVKEGIKYIPLFIIISTTFFLISSKILESLLSGIFI